MKNQVSNKLTIAVIAIIVCATATVGMVIGTLFAPMVGLIAAAGTWCVGMGTPIILAQAAQNALNESASTVVVGTQAVA